MANTKNTCQACIWDGFLNKLYFGLIFIAVWLVPFAYSTHTSELFELPKMLLVYVLATITTFIWLIRMVVTQQFILPKTRLDIPILLFLLTEVISSITSVDQYTSIFGFYSRFNGGLTSTIAYTLIYFSFASNLAQLKTDKTLVIKYFFVNLVAAMIALSLYAIPEKFGHAFSCLGVTGQWSTACWQDNTNPQHRIFGSFGQPNWLAAYLITLIPLSLSLVAKPTSSKKSFRVLGVVASGVAIVAVWLTGSRSGIIGMLVSGLILVLGTIVKLYKKNSFSRSLKIWLIGIGLVISGLGGVYGWKWWQQSSDITPSLTQGSDSGAIRRIVWSGAWQIWLAHPWLGTGPETFAYSYYRYRPVEHNLLSEWDFLYNKAHNEWLNLLANTGILGLVGFGAIRITVLWLIWRNFVQPSPNPSKSGIDATYLLAIGAGIIALEISNFFGFSTVSVNLIEYLLFAVVATTARSSSVTQITTTHSIAFWHKLFNRKIIQLGLIGVGGWATAQFLRTTYNVYQADLNYVTGKSLLEAGELDRGIETFNQAINNRPEEALFYDTLADQYSIYAQALIQNKTQKEGGLIKELAQKAVDINQYALKLNPHHLNFYKTRIRILTRIYPIDPQALNQALESIALAEKLAPTDAKLVYNQARITQYLGQTDQAIKLYQKTLELRPNYPEPRFELAQIWMDKHNWQEASKHYQYIVDFLNPNDPIALKSLKKIQASQGLVIK